MGTVAFSPPTPFGRCVKFHICRTCWQSFLIWVALGIRG